MQKTYSRKDLMKIAIEEHLKCVEFPRVGVVIAKRAVEMRMQINGFTSARDFCERLALMPHFATQIENLTFITPIRPEDTPQRSIGRVVDI